MTIAEIQSLSPEERRVKCAELSGWVQNRTSVREQYSWWKDGRSYSRLPDPDHDINACAELEKTLTDEEWYRYQEEIHWTSKPNPSYASRHLISASPEARVTAFLVVKGETK